jgi:hypothetical protein
MLRGGNLVIAGFLALSVALPAFADQEEHGTSSTGKFEWELRGTVDSGKEIWLWEAGHKRAARKLCDTEGWCCLHMHFSPEDDSLVVEDGGASLGISLRLFRHVSSAEYHEITEPDINLAAEHAALEAGRLPKNEALDHLYVKCLGWSADSTSILIRVTGKGSSTTRPHFNILWFAAYYFAPPHFETDLRQFNGKVLLPSR